MVAKAARTEQPAALLKAAAAVAEAVEPAAMAEPAVFVPEAVAGAAADPRVASAAMVAAVS